MVELPGETAGKIPDAGSDSSVPVSKQPRKVGRGGRGEACGQRSCGRRDSGTSV